CRRCGPCWQSSSPCGRLRLKACWRSSRGCSSATTKRIERSGRDDKRTDEAWERDSFYYSNNVCLKKFFLSLTCTTKSSSTWGDGGRGVHDQWRVPAVSQDRAGTALLRTSTFGSELNDAVGLSASEIATRHRQFESMLDHSPTTSGYVQKVVTSR